ncbi:hypothetical protein ACI2OX_07190 [Bacillus sp. N9]
MEVAYTKCDDWLADLKDYIQENIAFTKEFCKEHMPKITIIEPEGTF